MQQYINVVQDDTGIALGGVTVTVYNTGTTTAASIYSADDTGAALANPFTNETDGSVNFYAPNGRYDIVYEKTGYTFDDTDTEDILFLDVLDDREFDVVVHSTQANTLQTAYTRTFAEDFFSTQGQGFDLEIWHSITGTVNTKTVEITLGAATLLTATIAASTATTKILVKLRVVAAATSSYVLTEIYQNGVTPVLVYTDVTTVDFTAADRTLTVKHDVTNIADTSHIRNVDLRILR